LAALHSFWYEEALEAFREATAADPEFLMGYWGEAMAHNHPLWNEQDTEAARQVLEKIKGEDKVTARERAYLNAVRALYGEGDKLARDRAYSAAMERIHKDYPEDLEAAAFYSLSLQGLVRPEDRGFRNQARAGAVALDVYTKNPNHPGAAHYIIHAFDDPEHAIIALPAARRYAEIAPAAHHARHMPSHIFLQLGMWPEAATSNESAWKVSSDWVERKSLSPSLRDYHSLHWLLYVYLQQGRQNRAKELLETMREAMKRATDDQKLRPGMHSNNYAEMASVYIVETEKWDLAPEIFKPLKEKEQESEGEGAHHGAHGAGAAEQSGGVRRVSNRAKVLPIFVNGLAAARAAPGEAERFAEDLARMADGGGQSGAYNRTAARVFEIRQLEIKALARASRGNHDEAIELMKNAVALEEEMSSPSGPPSLIKPAHELFGEILLKAGHAREAGDQFAKALLRQPNRARSLLGAARAASKAGDAEKARSYYSTLLRIWEKADDGLPELREVQEYLRGTSSR
jgi:tetratricopeptide (TPR) repeat protein